MIKYGKVLDINTGLCEVALGTNIDFYKSIGYTELDIKQSDVDGGYYLTEKCPMKTDEEKEQAERERIGKLHLTKREVFLGLRKARNVLPEQIRAQITDPDALIEFDYATEYYRGNPLIDMVGGALGIKPEQLDKFFETNDYTYLVEPEPAPEKLPLEEVPPQESEENI